MTQGYRELCEKKLVLIFWPLNVSQNADPFVEPLLNSCSISKLKWLQWKVPKQKQGRSKKG